MPHVTIKLLTGRSADQKTAIADAVTQAVMATANCAESSVSVSIEDVEAQDWRRKVYDPEITGRPDILVKKPGYDPE